MTDTPEYLTVKELAQLLRIKERKVYDLAAAGDIPCTRATGKLLFPEADVRAWIGGKQTGAAARPSVFLGSHDPLLEWVLRQSHCGLASFFDSSRDGVARFKAGEGMATGLHIHDAETDDWNIATARDCADMNAVLVSWATRRRGLVTKRRDIASIDDIAGLRVALRQPTSGTSVLWTRLIEQARVPIKPTEPYQSEQDAVLAVVEDAADVTFGLEAVAHQFGLAFTPLIEERFDLLIDRAAYFSQPMQALLAFCRSGEFADRAKAMKGYDVSALGTVRWNA